jgi:hypothetical protein
MEKDEKVVALIRKRDVQRIRKRRENNQMYREEYKNLMLQFLISIFVHPLSNILKTKFGNFSLFNYSIFEGIKSNDVPKIEDFEI